MLSMQTAPGNGCVQGLHAPVVSHCLQVLLQNITCAAVSLHLHVPALGHVAIPIKGVLPFKGVHYGTNLQSTARCIMLPYTSSQFTMKSLL